MPRTPKSRVESSPKHAVWIVAWLAWLCAGPAWSYIVYLKDGQQINTQDAPRIEGDKAYLTLLSGTETVLDAAEIDLAKTAEVNKTDYGQARIIEGGQTQQIESGVPTAQRETLSDMLRRTGRRLQLPSNQPPPEAAADANALKRTDAGYIDLRAIRRTNFPDPELAAELLQYLRGRDLDLVSVYAGTHERRALVVVKTETEALVFKAVRDCANALVHMRENSAPLDAIELLMTTNDGIRGGQFTLTPELADVLLSGSLKPEAFFLRFVEF